MSDIEINNYDYELPAERIAQYPLKERDSSNLLINKGNNITKDIFRNIDKYLPSDSLLIFNNTKVIRARILFRKDSGALIEILCLEPLMPAEYELSFGSKQPVDWKCIIGNLKKWKSGILKVSFFYLSKEYEFTAELLKKEEDTQIVRFHWNTSEICFGEVIEIIGHIPLPPYITRADEAEDISRYQTLYSSVKGSVAAPTAGLHFTEGLLEKIGKKGFKSDEITLHIGAGTFKPVKSETISGHEMHCEHFYVKGSTLELIRENQGKIIAVGTTSVRTLESLYWMGVKSLQHPESKIADLSINQWEVYNMQANISVSDSMEALLKMIRKSGISYLKSSTRIIIIPGYNFRMINGIITNFHQPRSTLLLLISAWLGETWKKTYNFALENGFRFLSYGDSSLLIR